jgi:hypothetical protein
LLTVLVIPAIYLLPRDESAPTPTASYITHC